MCAGLDSTFESSHSIFWMCGFVSSMGNCLGDLPTLIIFPCKGECSCRKSDVLPNGKIAVNKRCGISIFSCNSGVISAITAAFVIRNIAAAFTFISQEVISSINERWPMANKDSTRSSFVALYEQLDEYHLTKKWLD
jgi:hypothetical protein